MQQAKSALPPLGEAIEQGRERDTMIRPDNRAAVLKDLIDSRATSLARAKKCPAS
jgi:hypothetical protein